MKNNYIPETMDLDIFLEGEEIASLRQGPLEGDLTELGESLDRRLILKYDPGVNKPDGIKVEPIRSDPDGGWEALTAYEVSINEYAYTLLKTHGRTGSRHGIGAHITIIHQDSGSRGSF